MVRIMLCFIISTANKNGNALPFTIRGDHVIMKMYLGNNHGTKGEPILTPARTIKRINSFLRKVRLPEELFEKSKNISKLPFRLEDIKEALNKPAHENPDLVVKTHDNKFMLA